MSKSTTKPPKAAGTEQPPHPPAISASIQAALDIASDDCVNLDTAAEYLTGANPGYFKDHAAAVSALEEAAALRVAAMGGEAI